MLSSETREQIYQSRLERRKQKSLNKNLKPKSLRQTTDAAFDPRLVVKRLPESQGDPQFKIITFNNTQWNISGNIPTLQECQPQPYSKERMFEVMNELAKRQDLNAPNSKELKHTQAMDFFIQNWNMLAPMFGLREEEQFFPRTFVEVDLGNEKGRTDVIGVAKLGTLQVFEIGSHNKGVKQVQNHTTILYDIFKDYQLQIIPYVVKYDFTQTRQLKIERVPSSNQSGLLSSVSQSIKAA